MSRAQIRAAAPLLTVMRAVRGDFERLRELARRFGELASPSTREDLSRAIAEEAMHQVHEGFAQGRDPYGSKWPEQIRTGETLRDTGRLRNSFSYSASAGGFRLGTNALYARIHQYGGVIKAKHVRMSTHRTFTPGGGSSTIRTMRFVARPMLRFQIEVGRRVFTKSGKRVANPRARSNAIMAWVMVPQVTIPKRQMVPEGNLGSIWRDALETEADQVAVRLTARRRPDR